MEWICGGLCERPRTSYFHPGMSAPPVSTIERMAKIETTSTNTSAVPAMTMRALRAKRYSRDSSRGEGVDDVSHTEARLRTP